MGGTCVIRGCVPKKLMIFASQAALMAEEMRAMAGATRRPGHSTGVFSARSWTPNCRA